MTPPAPAARARQGRCRLRGPIHASRRVGLGRTRCGASAQVRRHEGHGCVGGSRFLQTDPIKGGNANDYDYCTADPINCYDLDGRWGIKKFFKKAAHFVSANHAVLLSGLGMVACFTTGPVCAGVALVGAAVAARDRWVGTRGGGWSKLGRVAVGAAGDYAMYRLGGRAAFSKVENLRGGPIRQGFKTAFVRMGRLGRQYGAGVASVERSRYGMQQHGGWDYLL